MTNNHIYFIPEIRRCISSQMKGLRFQKAPWFSKSQPQVFPWFYKSALISEITLQRRHNGRNGVSNHQHHHCLLNRLFRRKSNKTPKLRVTGLCVETSLVTGEFPAQRASNADDVSHHETCKWNMIMQPLVSIGFRIGFSRREICSVYLWCWGQWTKIERRNSMIKLWLKA